MFGSLTIVLRLSLWTSAHIINSVETLKPGPSFIQTEPDDRKPRSSVIIGVAGGSGSGKTTVANAILERVGRERIAVIPHDAYYRDLAHMPRIGEAINFDHPDSLETDLLIEHLQRLRAGQAVDVPIYDHARFVRTGQFQHVEPKPVILVEGILIFAEPRLREMFDVKIYVDTDADLRFIRRLQRDITERKRTVESVIQQYLTTVRPMHLEFVEPSKRYADIIIPEGGYNVVALDLIAARIQQLLEEGEPTRYQASARFGPASSVPRSA